MSSMELRQYLDLYDAHREAICRHSAPALNAQREAAAERLRGLTLPRKGSEHYETTSLAEMLAPDYGVNINRVALEVNPAESFKCGVPRLSTSLFLMVNDRFALTPTSLNGLPDGLTIGSLAALSERHPEMVAPYYGRLASLCNPVAALNTLLAQDGLLVHVARGVKVEKPLQLVSILSSATEMMAVRRILVVLEEGAEVKILGCDHTHGSGVRMMNLQTVEIFAGRGSRLDFSVLEESDPLTTRLSALYLEQQEDSDVTINGITLFNGSTRNEYHSVFRGAGSKLYLGGMGIVDKSRHLDTYSYVEHAVGGCDTEELFKYVLDEEATGCFEGMIKVDEGAEKTEARQSNRNLVGSAKARMYSKPQLEIYNDDVKCSHGSATGSLDEMQLFYMRTRGLSEGEARLLLKQAFLQDVIGKVRIPVLRDRLAHLVERRIQGYDETCSRCADL